MYIPGEVALSFIESLLKEVEVGPDHPFFYPRVCTYLIRTNAKQAENDEEIVRLICNEEFEDISRRLDRTGLQEATSVRNILKARLIATKLIGEDGELEHHLLPLFIKSMREKIACLAPKREPDYVRDRHILNVLELLESNKEISRLLRSMTRPMSNRLAEQIIRDTLALGENQTVTDVHVKRATLSAWLTFLRQSLGSCFATAPAILNQHEQPIHFLRDLDEMMHTGRMRRTFAGQEYSVPMSSTWGNGDLRRPIVLEKDVNYNESKVWMAPGLIAALDAASVFPEGMTVREKSHDIHKRLKESVTLLEKSGSTFVTNAEEIIKALLLHHHAVKESDLEAYLNRPKVMMQSAMIMPGAEVGRGKKDPIVSFLKDFEVAKRAFKMLADNALLKSWEFTLASFSEVNMNFTRWNLYASLGINREDPGGIGDCLYQLVAGYVERANLAMKEQQLEYDEILTQMHYIEGRARTASTEKEIAWVKMEYQSRQTELYHIEQLCKMARERATKIANLYQFLRDEFDEQFPNYFQEVYDAEIHDIAQGPFDDSPAGFRLLFKHGRTNPSQWTRIYTLQEYIDALASFFTIMEIEIRDKPEIRSIESQFSHIITQLIGHVRSDEFMESSFYRMAKAHNVRCVEKPLENLDKVEKKPWVYTSGGSMATLVSAYFRREEKPTEVSRWVENETELLAFFIDSIKQLPAQVSDLYIADMTKSMLIHSPTHAFLLKPGLFKDAWKTDLYTYSWIKQSYLEPAREQLEKLYIDEEMGRVCINELYYLIPQDFRPRFKQVFEQLPYRLSSVDFRDYIVNTLYVDRGLRTFKGPVISPDEVDSVLYSHLPYMAKEKVKPLLVEILEEIVPNGKLDDVVNEVMSRLEMTGYMSVKRFVELTKACAIIILKSTRVATDLHGAIVDALRKRNLMLPAPLIFADSNWVKDYFAFVVSPTSHELELWSVDYYGAHGRPISYWKQWVNGSRRDLKWGIYSRPLEYVK